MSTNDFIEVSQADRLSFIPVYSCLRLLCCCIHVAFLYSFVVLVIFELCFGGAASGLLTLVDNGVFADGVGVAVGDELNQGIDHE